MLFVFWFLFASVLFSCSLKHKGILDRCDGQSIQRLSIILNENLNTKLVVVVVVYINKVSHQKSAVKDRNGNT